MGGDGEPPQAVRERTLRCPHKSYAGADHGFSTATAHDPRDLPALLCKCFEGKGKEEQEAEAYDMSK